MKPRFFVLRLGNGLLTACMSMTAMCLTTGCHTNAPGGHPSVGLWSVETANPYEAAYEFDLLLKDNGEGAWLRGWRSAFPNVVTYQVQGHRLRLQSKFFDEPRLELVYDPSLDVLRSPDGRFHLRRHSDANTRTLLLTLSEATNTLDLVSRFARSVGQTNIAEPTR
jgi:hypothetical protein